MGMLREPLHASARKRFQLKVGGKLCYFSSKKTVFKSGEYNVKLWVLWVFYDIASYNIVTIWGQQ